MRAFWLSGLLALTVGCSSSENALYRNIAEDTIFDPQFVGRWESLSEEAQPGDLVIIERVGETNQYRITVKTTSQNDSDNVLEGYLVRLGEDLLFDVVVPGDEHQHHHWWRIRADEPGRVMIDFADLAFLKQKPNLIAHEIEYATVGVPLFPGVFIPVKTRIPGHVTLTATSEELRRFFRDYRKELWKNHDAATILQRMK